MGVSMDTVVGFFRGIPWLWVLIGAVLGRMLLPRFGL